MRKSTSDRTVQVELPLESLEGHPSDSTAIAEELRQLWVLEQVGDRRLSSGRATELLDMPLVQFLERMGKHHLTTFDYDGEAPRASSPRFPRRPEAPKLPSSREPDAAQPSWLPTAKPDFLALP